MIHMDGQSPSGFTSSNYTGMAATGPWTAVPGTATNGGGGTIEGGGGTIDTGNTE